MITNSPACEKNKQVILNVLLDYFPSSGLALEIGSGTGQHAEFFAQYLPKLSWQTSDLQHNHLGIISRIDATAATNILHPVTLDVDQYPWPIQSVDAIFSANTAHIMSWNSVQKMINGAAKILIDKGVFCLYGPFNYQGEFTSESNKTFDQWLKNEGTHRGIRDFEAIYSLATQCGLALTADVAMPANNRTLVFTK